MANTGIERLQAPSGGICTDASPDYVPSTQAPTITNMLAGRPGSLVMRGPVRQGFTSIASTSSVPEAYWSYDDIALIRVQSTGTKYFKLDAAAVTSSDVTASLAKKPYYAGSGTQRTYARYGGSVYGQIDDATNAPALGKWDGNTTIALQTNAPYKFTDLQAYAQRLFVLGGTAPGTTTPIVNGGRVLFYSDPDPAADLSLLASWQDNVSGLVNQIQYDGDDTPIGLASCGRYIAIIGSRSINVLSGSGSSSFSIKNLTKNMGCIGINTIVEVDDGFFFMSDRGVCFCDGSTITNVSAPNVQHEHIVQSQAAASPMTAEMLNNGYISLASPDFSNGSWLFHIDSRTWTKFTFPTGGMRAVFRTKSYPLFWAGIVLQMFLADVVTNPYTTVNLGQDNDGSSDVATAAEIWTRAARLGSPSSMSAVQRLLIDFRCCGRSTVENAFRLQVWNTLGVRLLDTTIPTTATSGSQPRQRFEVEVFGEADAVQIQITNGAAGAPSYLYFELYDAWLEYASGQKRGSL